jgi:SAM-dependent methyltransferase
LWELGYRRLTAIDFAAELVAQAQALVTERGVHGLDLFRADATRMPLAAEDDPAARLRCRRVPRFDGALFMFNGLMQIPGRARRRRALREIHRLVAIDAPLLFTTHDRDDSREERLLWKLEARRWARGQQDPRLVDFGDRYFEDEAGRTFMHLPTRDEILEDLAATGWRSEYDIMRRHVARETAALPTALCVHLGAVMALFLTMPYGKFAHGIFRSAALLRYAVERRLPNKLGLSGE